MNIRKQYNSLIAATIILNVAFLTFLSCKKNGPTTAVITVLDTIGKPSPNASVTLWQDTSRSSQTGIQSTLRVTKTTDGSGKATFEFQYEAYVNILATKNGDTATGIVHLKEHETVSETVQLQ